MLDSERAAELLSMEYKDELIPYAKQTYGFASTRRPATKFFKSRAQLVVDVLIKEGRHVPVDLLEAASRGYSGDPKLQPTKPRGVKNRGSQGESGTPRRVRRKKNSEEDTGESEADQAAFDEHQQHNPLAPEGLPEEAAAVGAQLQYAQHAASVAAGVDPQQIAPGPLAPSYTAAVADAAAAAPAEGTTGPIHPILDQQQQIQAAAPPAVTLSRTGSEETWHDAPEQADMGGSAEVQGPAEVQQRVPGHNDPVAQYPDLYTHENRTPDQGSPNAAMHGQLLPGQQLEGVSPEHAAAAAAAAAAGGGGGVGGEVGDGSERPPGSKQHYNKGKKYGTADRSIRLSRMMSLQPRWCARYQGLTDEQQADMWEADVENFRAMNAHVQRTTAVNDWQNFCKAEYGGDYKTDSSQKMQRFAEWYMQSHTKNKWLNKAIVGTMRYVEQCVVAHQGWMPGWEWRKDKGVLAAIECSKP